MHVIAGSIRGTQPTAFVSDMASVVEESGSASEKLPHVSRVNIQHYSACKKFDVLCIVEIVYAMCRLKSHTAYNRMEEETGMTEESSFFLHFFI